MTSYWSSSFCTCELVWRSSSHPGALRVIAAIWSLMTGRDRDDEEREHPEHHDQHHQHGEPAPHAATHEELHDRVEPDREEHRHHEQDQDRGDAQQLLGQEDGDQGAEGTEEPDLERRVAQQQRCRRGLRRDVGGRRRLVDHEVDGVVDLLGDLRGRLRRLLGGLGGSLGAVGVLADLLHDLLDPGAVGRSVAAEPGWVSASRGAIASRSRSRQLRTRPRRSRPRRRAGRRAGR